MNFQWILLAIFIVALIAEIAKAIPDMDIVGFAPKSRGAHTTKEHLFVDTVEPFWQMLVALLERLCTMPE
jgi:di/tripeptidase